MASNELCSRLLESAASEPEAAVALARARWLVGRDDVLGALIVHLGERLAARYEGPSHRASVAFHAGWLEVALFDASEAATSWLASTLEQRVPVRDGFLWGGVEVRYQALFERLSVLRRRCPDPRVAGAVVRVLRRGIYGSGPPDAIEATYRPLVELLLAAGDPEVAGEIDELAGEPRSKRSAVRDWQREHLPAVADELAAITVMRLPGAERKALRRLVPRRGRGQPSADERALLQAVHAEPDDDGLRAVLADVWLARGDPRGTFVARQLAGEAGPALDNMVRRHGKDWLGPDLATTLKPVRWARGFLEEAALRPNHVASESVWAASYGDERLATLRVLRRGNGNQRHYEAFLRSEATRGLQRVEVPSRHIAQALAEAPPKALRVLEWARLPPQALLHALCEAPATVGVDTWRFGVNPDVAKLVPVLCDTPWCERLRALEVVSHGSQGPRASTARAKEPPSFLGQFSALATLPALERVWFGTGPSWLELRREPHGWCMHLDHRPGDIFWGPALYDGGETLALVPFTHADGLLGPVGRPSRLRLITPPPEVVRVVVHLDADDAVLATLEEQWRRPVVRATG